MYDNESRTVWCGNLSGKVTEELLYELFLQVAPLERVRIPTDKEGRKSNFAFVTMKHEVSVDYVVQMLNGTALYEKRINIKPRGTSQGNSAQMQLPHPQNVEHQNAANKFNDLFKMGQAMQLSCNNYLQRNDNRPGHNYPNERHRDNFKPYNKPPQNRYDNYSSNRQGRSGYHRSNIHNANDRSRRRYY